MKLRVALGQVESKLFDLKENAKKHIEYISRARDEGAGLIVFPELSLTGYYLQEAVADASAGLDDPALQELIAESKGIDVVTGFVEVSDDHQFFNSALLFGEGRIKGIHRKIYLPNYGMFEESRYFSAGNSLEPFDLSCGRAGILICEDAWHPRLAIELAERNLTAFIYISASPVKGVAETNGIVNKGINEDFAKFYARSFGVPVIFVNKIGYEHGIRFWGGSAVFDPEGTCLGSCSLETEDLKIVDIDLNQIRRSRTGFPYYRDEEARQPVDIY